MPRNTAIALSVACTAAGCGFLVAGLTAPGIALLVAGIAFDAWFVLALRARRKERP